MEVEGTRAAQRPRQAEVRAELVALRKAKGLDAGAVRTNGKKLQQLPVVDDELERSDFHVGDRAIAAVKAVRCAVEEMANNDPQSFEILMRTLTNRNRLQSLDAIRRNLMERFQYNETSRSHFDKLENDAYTRLAATLVEADISPCRAVEMEVVIEALVEIYARHQVEIDEVLSGYGYSIDDPILQQALRRALITKLPYGTHMLDAHNITKDLWPDALLILAYEVHQAELAHPAKILSRDYFYEEFIRPDAEAALRDFLRNTAGIKQRKLNPRALTLDLDRDDLETRRTYLVEGLARVLKLEELQHWSR